MAQTLKISLRCTSTGQVLDTGIRTSGREVLNTDIYRGGRIRCRFCGGIHSMIDAFAEPAEDALPADLWRPNAS